MNLAANALSRNFYDALETASMDVNIGDVKSIDEIIQGEINKEYSFLNLSPIDTCDILGENQS